MHVIAGSEVAFVVALMRCAVIEGGNADLDFRLTVGLRKSNDQ
jgi:ketosteroid isomerase-like protein